MNPIIKIQNLSKMYRLGTIGTGTISHDLNRWWYKVRGKEDPYLKIGEANVSDNKSSSGYVWALKDINLEVIPGEVLGIIGKNGAGKSTLLKILSRVTGPTTGSISYSGRIGSLLEVGTGFHPELTGRENIFLNGAILGMTKSEIRRKFDEIVDFAGVERYIDTPVKRYSSGMKVRLGFAVAAHLEPEILVVDEVLAVGDAEFQKKAIGKMQDVSTKEGRTILFVSHNMAAVKSLCTRAIRLENGLLIDSGTPNEIVTKYLTSRTINKNFSENVYTGKQVEINSIAVISNNEHNALTIDEPFQIKIDFRLKEIKNRIDFTFQFLNTDELPLFAVGSGIMDEKIDKIGNYIITCDIPPNFFNTSTFKINLLIVENKRIVLKRFEHLLSIELLEGKKKIGDNMGRSIGDLKPKFNWKLA